MIDSQGTICTKAKRMIEGCTTVQQLEVTRNFIDNYYKLFLPANTVVVSLEELYEEKRIFISPFETSLEMMLLIH